MKTLYKYIILFAAIGLVYQANAQEKKVWVTGAARGVMYGDDFTNNSENDTTTIRKTQGGHAMVDLGVNIQPNENILIKSMVRVRNDYGGFWGSGVTFDVRQLYIKGIIGGFLRYQLGDIDYRYTPYTFYNNTGLVNQFNGPVTSTPFEQVRYDVFYMDDNTWRQQGGAIDFALEFTEVIKEVRFDAFTTRIRPTDFGNQNDRLYSGFSAVLEQGQFLNLSGQYVNMYDLEGTSNSNILLRNPVMTGGAEFFYDQEDYKINAAIETGQSKLEWQNDAAAPVFEDFFYDIQVKGNLKKTGIELTAGYRNVGPNYRSAGAQTMQINFNGQPQAYDRYGNAQLTRQISMLDLSRDASLYNMQINPVLANYDPRYDNATPYGVATPNRQGATLKAAYKNQNNIWNLNAQADLLSDVVGQGTSALKEYNTYVVNGGLEVGNLLEWEERKLDVNATYGMQQTSRSGSEEFESVDLSTNFTTLSLITTIYKNLEFIAEYRTWQTEGFDLVAERNTYSQVIDFTEYSTDYTEAIVGAGIQYNFGEKSVIKGMYQTLDWDERAQNTQSYGLDTYTIQFTMKF